jgi:DNA-binding transcriptional MerR regulator
MAENTLYTFKDICEKAGVPYSTGRYYRDKHREFMYAVGNGRNKRYTGKTAEVLRFIGNAYQSGASATEVQQRLSRSYPVNQADEDEVSQCSVTTQHEGVGTFVTPLALIANIAKQQQAFQEILERTAEALEESHEREQALEHIAKALEKANERDAEVAYLRAEVERMKRKIQETEKRQENRLWQRLKMLVTGK